MEKRSFNDNALPFLLIALCSCFVSCSRERSKDRGHEELALGDTCSFCVLDSFSIKPIKENSDVGLIIDQPVAIIFSNQYDWVQKYHKEETYDTLMKLLKMKHASDRNIIYELTEQNFYFDKEIKPVLIDNSIAIIDTINRINTFKTIAVAEFRGTTKTFQVNLLDYKDRDGVLLFNPAKDPIFWTFKKEGLYCKDLYGLVRQYYLCSAESGSN